MENLNIKIDNPDIKELVIREDQARPHHDPLKISISGDIRTVGAYVQHRKATDASGFQWINDKTAIVIVDKEKNTITLSLNPNDKFGTEITATLEESEELKSFMINSTKTFSQSELVKIFKFSRLLFSDPAKQEEILKAYQAFTYSASTAGGSSADARGNKANSFTKNVTTNLPEEFILRIPLFKGQEEKVFRVDVCYDVTEGSARFWFESVELKELLKIEKDRIFDRELKACDGLVILFK